MPTATRVVVNGASTASTSHVIAKWIRIHERRSFDQAQTDNDCEGKEARLHSAVYDESAGSLYKTYFRSFYMKHEGDRLRRTSLLFYVVSSVVLSVTSCLGERASKPMGTVKECLTYHWTSFHVRVI